ncbi:MAG TPA: TonB family protein [Steroidobacteraceae bacterium]|nr:TonB family protein [Steroidobacteraceae bacterium]
MTTYDSHFPGLRRAPALMLALALHALVILGALTSRYITQVSKPALPPRLIVDHIVVPRPVAPSPVHDPGPIPSRPPVIVLQTPPEVRVPADPPLDRGPPDIAGVIPPAPPSQHRVQPASIDPRYPLRIGEEYYPDASRRAGEEGRCLVRVSVAASGRVDSAVIVQSSGFARLDAACLDAVKGRRMRPATDEGVPIESTTLIPIKWHLSPSP